MPRLATLFRTETTRLSGRLTGQGTFGSPVFFRPETWMAGLSFLARGPVVVRSRGVAECTGLGRERRAGAAGRAVDQGGDVIDVYLQSRRDAEAARRFFRRLLRSHGTSPRKIVTDKLGSHGVARRELMPETIHRNDRHADNRAELSQQPTRATERGMRRFSSPRQAQRFLSAHAVVHSLFNLQRHLASAAFHRLRRARAFKRWNEAVAA